MAQDIKSGIKAYKDAKKNMEVTFQNGQINKF